MKIALWVGFIIVFVWIISVIVTIVNPDVMFGTFSILTAIVGAIIFLFIVEAVR